MLIPLFVLAFGAVFAGILAEHWFVGEARGEFWKHSILVLPEHDAIAAAEHCVVDHRLSAAHRRAARDRRSPISAIR